MNRNGLDLPPKGTKPYWDYLDKNYEKEENPNCAAAAFTMEKLNEALNEVEL